MVSSIGRVATANGVMLADPELLGNSLAGAGEALFEPSFWQQRGELRTTPGGRGGSFFVGGAAHSFALRHYLRGGFIAKLVTDRYVWSGESRVRAFAEWHLLRAMYAQGLPVPRAVAAAYRRSGLSYSCDLLTVRIARADPLSGRLASGTLPNAAWRMIGATVQRFHQAGIDHADLNAHNILWAADSGVSVIDFDRGRERAAGNWQRHNLERLRRSLDKLSAPMPAGRFGDAQWQELLEGYAAGG